MRLYGVQLICGGSEARKTLRAQERQAARALVDWALRRDFGEKRPLVLEKDAAGRPCFPARPELQVSISHSDGFVLCGLGFEPLGVDVQRRRPVSETLRHRLTDEAEQQDFEFFELWTLRESLFKLTGTGSLRESRFRRTAAGIFPPIPGVQCRLYDNVPGCAAAVCAFADAQLPVGIEMVDYRQICT